MTWVKSIITLVMEGYNYYQQEEAAGKPTKQTTGDLVTGDWLFGGTNPLGDRFTAYALDPLDLFDSGGIFNYSKKRDKEREQDRYNLINKSFQEAYGRAPTTQEITDYDNAIKNKEINSPEQLMADLQSHDEYNSARKPSSSSISSLFQMPSESELIKNFKKRYEAVGNMEIIPKAEMDFINSQRDQLQSFVTGVRNGSIAPEVTDPAQRERLIEGAKQTYSRELAASEKANYESLSRRGVLPSVQTGVSGPAESVISKTRAEVYEDPLTSFIRNLDINNEQLRVQRQMELNDQALNVNQGLLAQGTDLGKFLAGAKMDMVNNISGTHMGLSNIAANQLANAMNNQLEKDRLEQQQNQFDTTMEYNQDAQSSAEDKEMWTTIGNIFGSYFSNSANSNIGGSTGYTPTNYSDYSMKDTFGSNAFESNTADYGFNSGFNSNSWNALNNTFTI
jgi:hypothetical protein